MEVPPFQRPEPALLHYPVGGQNPAGNEVQELLGHGEMGGVCGLCTAQAASTVSSP